MSTDLPKHRTSAVPDEQTDDLAFSRFSGSAHDSTQPWYETIPAEEFSLDPPASARATSGISFARAATALCIGALAIYAAAKVFGV